MNKDIQAAATGARASDRLTALLWQLPMVLLVVAWYALFVRLPYCSLDADAVNSA